MSAAHTQGQGNDPHRRDDRDDDEEQENKKRFQGRLPPIEHPKENQPPISKRNSRISSPKERPTENPAEGSPGKTREQSSLKSPKQPKDDAPRGSLRKSQETSTDSPQLGPLTSPTKKSLETGTVNQREVLATSPTDADRKRKGTPQMTPREGTNDDEEQEKEKTPPQNEPHSPSKPSRVLGERSPNTPPRMREGRSQVVGSEAAASEGVDPSQVTLYRLPTPPDLHRRQPSYGSVYTEGGLAGSDRQPWGRAGDTGQLPRVLFSSPGQSQRRGHQSEGSQEDLHLPPLNVGGQDVGQTASENERCKGNALKLILEMADDDPSKDCIASADTRPDRQKASRHRTILPVLSQLVVRGNNLAQAPKPKQALAKTYQQITCAEVPISGYPHGDVGNTSTQSGNVPAPAAHSAEALAQSSTGQVQQSQSPSAVTFSGGSGSSGHPPAQISTGTCPQPEEEDGSTELCSENQGHVESQNHGPSNDSHTDCATDKTTQAARAALPALLPLASLVGQQIPAQPQQDRSFLPPIHSQPKLKPHPHPSNKNTFGNVTLPPITCKPRQPPHADNPAAKQPQPPPGKKKGGPARKSRRGRGSGSSSGDKPGNLPRSPPPPPPPPPPPSPSSGQGAVSV